METNDPLENILPNIHEAVRKSLLLNELYSKLQSLPIGAFPFAPEFGKLRDVIADQIGDTRILFPEFTPHDEHLHVAKLFGLADKLFGNAYRQLNAAELFLLAAALYAHDWGMAVGQDEQAYLRHGASEEFSRDTFTPLVDEAERLAAFAQSEGLMTTRTSDLDFPTLSDHHLRLYVRHTHARRSGARIRAHFREHLAVGDALAQLCEGHWHDFATLDDINRFPREYEAGGQTVHVLALALQVRLVDLFHITDDRTPYSLWRFISPTDRRSSEEWKKHRALTGITVTSFPPGRAIKIQGFTEEEEVWAALQDLRRYCETQISGTLELSARHVPERYMLNFLKLEWGVTTGSLRPVDLSFGFDSNAMFRILSDDIYDGDPYVFLRELLQNSIDAVRTRRERLSQRQSGEARRKRTADAFDTTIYFTISHQADGDIHVSCRDYGIGMDEHVIRNYFTMAGISYYRSDEFKRQSLGFEPVSRFGIGILSCFMVADSLEVKTYRDPECGPAMVYSDAQLPSAEEHRSRRLYLKIPAVERQFIVKDLATEFNVGTEVSLQVQQRKVQPAPAEEDPSELRTAGEFRRTLEITEFLCNIAGFVEFPILVEERYPGVEPATVTLILHPDREADKEASAYEEFTDSLSIHQLSREYPWEAVVEPDSVDICRMMMDTDHFELRELFAEHGYEGWISFPRPGDGDFSEMGFADRTTILRRSIGEESSGAQVHWKSTERKENTPNLFGVYRDGIRLSGITVSRHIKDSHSTLGPSQILVNLCSTNTAGTNAARTNLADPGKSWDASIWTAIKDRLRATEFSKAFSLPADERCYRYGWLAEVYGLSQHEMREMIPNSERVSIWLVPPGILEFRVGHLSPDEEVAEVPYGMSDLIFRLIAYHYGCELQSPAPDFEWQGPASLINSLDRGFQHREAIGAPLLRGMLCVSSWSELLTTRLQFLQPPESIPRPILQPVGVVDTEALKATTTSRLSSRQKSIRQSEIMAASTLALENPSEIRADQIEVILQALNDIVSSASLRAPILFAPPFDQCLFAIGSKHAFSYVNRNTSVGLRTFQCFAAYALAHIEKRLPRTAVNEINALTYSAIALRHDASPISAREFVTQLFELVQKHNLIDGFVPPELLDEQLNVPQLQDCNSANGDRFDDDDIYPESLLKGQFGRLITAWPFPADSAADSG